MRRRPQAEPLPTARAARSQLIRGLPRWAARRSGNCSDQRTTCQSPQQVGLVEECGLPVTARRASGDVFVHSMRGDRFAFTVDARRQGLAGDITVHASIVVQDGPVFQSNVFRSKLRRMLTTREWARLGAMFALIVVLHLVGWGTLLFLVAPQHFNLGDKVLGLGVGLTAYALGLRHAFDADHIAAIDNTTRKLMGDGQRPMGVGFFFSLGHSTVVFGLALLLAVGIKAVVGPVADESSWLHRYTGVIGTSVSGVFLYAIAIINVVILVGILKVFARCGRGV